MFVNDPSRRIRVKTRWRIWLLTTLVCVGLILVACDDPNDDDSDADDDISDDDASDDDASDDDQSDDDVSDDDTPPPSIYDELNPTGSVLGETFGLASQMSGSPEEPWKREFEAMTLQQMEIHRIRVGFSWEEVEPADDQWDWSRTDILHQIGLDYDLLWDARLAYTVAWNAPGGSPSEIDPDDFADYSAHVAARYCSDIKRYEIWNEPNLYHFWEPEPDPAHYGLLLKAAYEAIKSECPDAEVLFGGLSSNNFSQEFYFNIYPFFDRVVAAHPDICNYFDLMPIHPYTILQMMRPEAAMDFLGRFAPDIPGQVDDIRARLTKAGCGDKPILFTEFGYPSTYIGDPIQAAYLIRTILLGMTRELAGYYLYTFWDKIGRQPPTENDFGLFEYPTTPNDEDHVPKASFFAYRTLVQNLSSTRFAGDLSSALSLPKNVYVLAFEDVATERLMVAAWDGRAKPNSTFKLSLPVPFGATTARLVKMDGETIDESLTDPLSLLLTYEVQYVEFGFASPLRFSAKETKQIDEGNN